MIKYFLSKLWKQKTKFWFVNLTVSKKLFIFQMGLGLWDWKKGDFWGSGHDFQFCEDRSSPRKMKGKEILACKLIQVISSSTRVETKRDQKLSGRSISNQILLSIVYQRRLFINFPKQILLLSTMDICFKLSHSRSKMVWNTVLFGAKIQMIIFINNTN